MTTFPQQSLRDAIDAVSSTYQQTDRYLLLIDNAPRVVTPTINTSTNILSTATTNTLVTGCRIRLSSTGTLPTLAGGASVDTQKDYFVRSLGTNTFTLHLDVGDAQSNSAALDFLSAGSGVVTATEQAFIPEDLTSVIVSRELIHPQYSRRLVEFLVESVIVNGRAERGPVFWKQKVNAGQAALTAGWVVMLEGASATVRNTVGDVKFTKALDPVFIVQPDSTEAISLLLTAY